MTEGLDITATPGFNFIRRHLRSPDRDNTETENRLLTIAFPNIYDRLLCWHWRNHAERAIDLRSTLRTRSRKSVMGQKCITSSHPSFQSAHGELGRKGRLQEKVPKVRGNQRIPSFLRPTFSAFNCRTGPLRGWDIESKSMCVFCRTVELLGVMQARLNRIHEVRPQRSQFPAYRIMMVVPEKLPPRFYPCLCRPATRTRVVELRLEFNVVPGGQVRT